MLIEKCLRELWVARRSSRRRKLEKRSWSWLSTSFLHVVSQVSSEVAGGLTTIVAAKTITLQNKTKIRCEEVRIIWYLEAWYFACRRWQNMSPGNCSRKFSQKKIHPEDHAGPATEKKKLRTASGRQTSSQNISKDGLMLQLRASYIIPNNPWRLITLTASSPGQ